jgi:N-methylhydantoinase B
MSAVNTRSTSDDLSLTVPTSSGNDALEYDPIAIEIIWSRLNAIADEAASILLRSSFSTIIREAHDYACVLMDADGQSLAESSVTVPAFNATLPRTLRYFFDRFPKESWRPGDVVITNDPWKGTGHLPDFTLATPIFRKGRLVAFAGSIAHLSDIGGTLLGADTKEVYEEGLCIPILKIIEQGKINEEVIRILKANVRIPHVVMGDLYAQIAGAEACVDRLLALMDEYDLESLESVSRITQQLAENAMRTAIRKIPEGTYHGSVETDGYGEPLQIKVAVTVKDGEIVTDFTGSSPQVERGAINCPTCYGFAYSAYSIKCAIDPATPKNEGSFRPLKFIAPLGTIVNPRPPAAVNARHLTGHILTSAIYGALAQAIPKQVVAECGGQPNLRAQFSGIGHDENRFVFTLFGSGGMGARPDRDGLHCTPFPSNSIFGSVEAIENFAPLIFWRKEMPDDSGGAGQFTGGSGQQVLIQWVSPKPGIVSFRADRTNHPAQGYFGGLSGSPARLRLFRGRAGEPPEVTTQAGEPVNPKGQTRLVTGDILEVTFPGGGGYGPPKERERQKILDALQDGLLSPDAAGQIYGVRER